MVNKVVATVMSIILMIGSFVLFYLDYLLVKMFIDGMFQGNLVVMIGSGILIYIFAFLIILGGVFCFIGSLGVLAEGWE